MRWLLNGNHPNEMALLIGNHLNEMALLIGNHLNEMGSFDWKVGS